MMASENELNLFRLIAFLLRIVPMVIHDFMEAQYFGVLSFEEYLNKHKHVLFHLTTLRMSLYKCCQCGEKPIFSRCIAENQFDMLFARTGSTPHNKTKCMCMFNARGDIDKSRLDISLAICILRNCESVHPNYERHLNILRDIRNDVFHCPSANFITSDMFIRLWDGLTRAINGLTSAMGQPYASEIMLQIKSLKDESFVCDEMADLSDIWLTVQQTMQENTKEIGDLNTTLGRIENKEQQIFDVVKENAEKLSFITDWWNTKQFPPNERHIYIHIPLWEKTTKVLYEKKQTVEELKTLIHQAGGIKRQEQVLKFRNVTLNDEKTVHSYGNKRGDTVLLTINTQALTDAHNLVSLSTASGTKEITTEDESNLILMLREQSYSKIQNTINKDEMSDIINFMNIKYQYKMNDELKKKNTYKPETEQNKIYQNEETSQILVAIGHLKDDNRTQLQQLERQLREHIDYKKEGVKSLVIQMSTVTNTSKKWNHRRSQENKKKRYLDDRMHERRLKYLPSKRRYKRDPREERVVSINNHSMVLSDNSAVTKTLFNAHSEDANMLIQKRCSTRHFDDSEIILIEGKFGNIRKEPTATKALALTPKFAFIKDFSGKDIDIEIHRCTTVIDIKQQIQFKTRVPVANQKLIYGGLVLENNVSVITYGITENSNVYMTPQDNASVERNMPTLVWIRHIESRIVRQIDIIPLQRIIDLKLLIRQKLGISKNRGIIVIFSGETLKNYEYFEVIGIQANDTIDWYDYTIQ